MHGTFVYIFCQKSGQKLTAKIPPGNNPLNAPHNQETWVVAAPGVGTVPGGCQKDHRLKSGHRLLLEGFFWQFPGVLKNLNQDLIGTNGMYILFSINMKHQDFFFWTHQLWWETAWIQYAVFWEGPQYHLDTQALAEPTHSKDLPKSDRKARLQFSSRLD